MTVFASVLIASVVRSCATLLMATASALVGDVRSDDL